jgi:hypothetical protein
MAVLRAASEGFAVLAVAYDALLVSMPENGADVRIAELREIITDAADLQVGIRIRIGCQVIRPGERFLTPESQRAWEQMRQALEEATLNL